ncbi:MAG: hypothetical protein HUU57_06120 [Bdellovibrio sp.]|nr:hypothetical protein [Bdellovibrio sp.]
MTKDTSFLNSRSLWIYYALFISGALVLVYQSSGWSVIGDSVNFLCLLFFLNSLAAKKPLHIIENSLLMTVGYILPLLIRNSIKLTYAEAPSMSDFFKLAMVSTSTTLLLGCVFSCIGFTLTKILQKALRVSKGRITMRPYPEE